MPKLAINGGAPVISKALPRYNTIGQEEKDAVMRVMESGNLSQYIGSWNKDFWGGPVVRELEKFCAEKFGTKYALAVNSATSGLYAAMGAFGIGPGDEVIVPPFTMVATVSAALVWGGIPVFADLDPETFCISPAEIRKKITKRTKAIAAVDLFGHPADYDEIMKIAEEHNLMVLEDAAQAPGVLYKGKTAGTLAHAGVYSLNYHKHVHCGEGGIVFTDSEEIMNKVALIRNHAEAVVRGMEFSDLTNMIGQNYRLTELHAAIALEQYKKLDGLVKQRIKYADRLTARLEKLDGITPPQVQKDCEHAYYAYPVTYDASKLQGVHRDVFTAALNAEGLPARAGYCMPIYLEPAFQKRIAIGREGFPFNLSKVSYNKGDCPACENMWQDSLICLLDIHGQMTNEDVDLIATVFEKVHANIGELQAKQQARR